jgi:hypothetical protein
VFERADVNPATLEIASMRGIKRTTRAFGAVRGHRAGLRGERLLSYAEARREIDLPVYGWVLANRLSNELGQLAALARSSPALVLLHFETNCDVDVDLLDPDDATPSLSAEGAADCASPQPTAPRMLALGLERELRAWDGWRSPPGAVVGVAREVLASLRIPEPEGGWDAFDFPGARA